MRGKRQDKGTERETNRVTYLTYSMKKYLPFLRIIFYIKIHIDLYEGGIERNRRVTDQRYLLEL